MIPVRPRPEPADFDRNVRKPGRTWLKKKGIPLNRKLARGTRLEPFWRKCLDDLHRDYKDICAYLCVYIQRCTGGGTVDHFAAKSRVARLAYEWSNYRLACSAMNARKGVFDDVLDPFTLRRQTFRLELVTGRIYPNPCHSKADRQKAEDTIRRLGLDDYEMREMRSRHYREFAEKHCDSAHLRRHSPFVWFEARRLKLL